MGSTEEHQKLLDDILVALNALSHVRAFRMNVGVAQTFRGNVVRFGFKGLPDIIGIVGPVGRFLALDVKTGKAVLSPEQQKFCRRVNLLGGIAGAVHSIEEALSLVQ